MNFEALLMLGVSMAGSAVQGAIIKHKTGADNDTIPVKNGATWGTIGAGAAAAMHDPMIAVAGLAGPVITSIGHKLIKRFWS